MFQGSQKVGPIKYQRCFMKVLCTESFKGVVREFLGNFECVSRYFKEVLRMIQGSLSRVFQKQFEDVLGMFLRMFEASFKGGLKQFQGSFWRVSSKFVGVSWKFHEWLKSVSKKF